MEIRQDLLLQKRVILFAKNTKNLKSFSQVKANNGGNRYRARYRIPYLARYQMNHYIPMATGMRRFLYWRFNYRWYSETKTLGSRVRHSAASIHNNSCNFEGPTAHKSHEIDDKKIQVLISTYRHCARNGNVTFDQRPSNLSVVSHTCAFRSSVSFTCVYLVTCGVLRIARAVSLRNKIVGDAINRSLALTEATFQTNNPTSCHATASRFPTCSLVNKKRWRVMRLMHISEGHPCMVRWPFLPCDDREGLSYPKHKMAKLRII